MTFRSRAAKAVLTGALRRLRPSGSSVVLDSCGKNDQIAVNLISFGSFALFGSFDEETDGLESTRNEKAPVGAEDFFCNPMFWLPAIDNHLTVDGVTFVVS